jgi:hypothetical protein
MANRLQESYQALFAYADTQQIMHRTRQIGAVAYVGCVGTKFLLCCFCLLFHTLD